MKLRLEPTYKQHLAWQILWDNVTEEFLFGGGAGGGKSWLGCEWLITMCLQYPDTRYFIARKRLKTLKMTTLRTFFKVCKKQGLKRDVHYRYREQQSVIEFIETGAAIDLLEVDLRPSDPEFEDLGSSEYTSGWIEEAGEVSFGAYDTLTSRIGRQMNDVYGILGKLFITCNPKKNWLYKMFYLLWKKGELPINRQFLQSLVDDNPKNESGYRNKLVNLKNPNKKQRLLFGNWEYDDDPSVLIDFEAISDLFSNTVEESSDKYLTADIARYGDDRIVLKLWRGMLCYKVIVRRKQSLPKTIDLIRDTLRDERIPYSHAVIDEDGIGGGVVDSLPGVRGFVANSSPLDDIRLDPKKDEVPNYANLKAQCSYMLADEVNNRRIAVIPEAIDTDEDDLDFESLLTEELEQIRARYVDDDEKKLRVIPKPEIKESLGRSPDFADNMVMRMIFMLRLPRFYDPSAKAHQYIPNHPRPQDRTPQLGGVPGAIHRAAQYRPRMK